jgi:hypothetical protein
MNEPSTLRAASPIPSQPQRGWQCVDWEMIYLVVQELSFPLEFELKLYAGVIVFNLLL